MAEEGPRRPDFAPQRRRRVSTAASARAWRTFFPAIAPTVGALAPTVSGQVPAGRAENLGQFLSMSDIRNVRSSERAVVPYNPYLLAAAWNRGESINKTEIEEWYRLGVLESRVGPALPLLRQLTIDLPAQHWEIGNTAISWLWQKLQAGALSRVTEADLTFPSYGVMTLLVLRFISDLSRQLVTLKMYAPEQSGIFAIFSDRRPLLQEVVINHMSLMDFQVSFTTGVLLPTPSVLTLTLSGSYHNNNLPDDVIQGRDLTELLAQQFPNLTELRWLENGGDAAFYLTQRWATGLLPLRHTLTLLYLDGPFFSDEDIPRFLLLETPWTKLQVLSLNLEITEGAHTDIFDDTSLPFATVPALELLFLNIEINEPDDEEIREFNIIDLLKGLQNIQRRTRAYISLSQVLFGGEYATFPVVPAALLEFLLKQSLPPSAYARAQLLDRSSEYTNPEQLDNFLSLLRPSRLM